MDRGLGLAIALALLTVTLPALAGSAAATHEDNPFEDHVVIDPPEQDRVFIWCNEDRQESASGCIEDVQRHVRNYSSCLFAYPPCAFQPEQSATVFVQPLGEECFDCPGAYVTASEDGAAVGYGAYVWCEHRVTVDKGVEDCYGAVDRWTEQIKDLFTIQDPP